MGKNSGEFLRNFSKLSLKTVIPQKSLLGTNSREFLENFRGISYKKWFLGNSLKKVTTVGESGEIPHFCYLGSYITMVLPSKIVPGIFEFGSDKHTNRQRLLLLYKADLFLSFVCTMCAKGFSSASALSYHEIYHPELTRTSLHPSQLESSSTLTCLTLAAGSTPTFWTNGRILGTTI